MIFLLLYSVTVLIAYIILVKRSIDADVPPSWGNIAAVSFRALLWPEYMLLCLVERILP